MPRVKKSKTARDWVDERFELIHSGKLPKSTVATESGYSEVHVRQMYLRACREQGIEPYVYPSGGSPRLPEGLTLLSDHAGSESPDGSALWDILKQRSNAKVEKESHERFSVSINDPLPVALCFTADQHIGGVCDYDQMEIDANLVRNTEGMYSVLAGDGIDNMIKHASAILHAHTTPDEQLSMFSHYLGMFGDKIVCMVAGNHDLWTSDIAGVDSLRRMSELKKIIYSKYEIRLTMKHGKQEYKVLIRHHGRNSSMYNDSHGQQQYLRHGEWDADVVVFGHLHKYTCTEFQFLGIGRWAIRPGSYKVYDAYGKSRGFLDSVPMCPTVIFYSDHRRMIGYRSLEDAARILPYERAEWKKGNTQERAAKAVKKR